MFFIEMFVDMLWLLREGFDNNAYDSTDSMDDEGVLGW